MNTQTLVCALALVANQASAQNPGVVVAYYDFTTVNNDPDETVETFNSPSVHATGASVAANITSPATHNGGMVHPEFGDAHMGGIGWSARGNNPASSFAVLSPIDTYFTFDVTPTAVPLTYTTLAVITGVAASLNGVTANDYTLSYSLDGSSFSVLGTIASGTQVNQDAASLSGPGSATSLIQFDITAIGTQPGQVFFRLDPVATAGTRENGATSQRCGWIDDVVVIATAGCQTDLGFQGPGSARATLCGTGLNTGEVSAYQVTGAPSSAAGALFLSVDGLPDVPVFGGTLVSFGGFVFDVPIGANPTGGFVVTIDGLPHVWDLVLQSVFLDPALPQNLAFTNAVLAQFGR